MNIKKNTTIAIFDKIRGESLTFGKMLESIRKADCISQVALAKKMKISKAYLCDIEKRTPASNFGASYAICQNFRLL